MIFLIIVLLPIKTTKEYKIRDSVVTLLTMCKVSYPITYGLIIQRCMTPASYSAPRSSTSTNMVRAPHSIDNDMKNLCRRRRHWHHIQRVLGQSKLSNKIRLKMLIRSLNINSRTLDKNILKSTQHNTKMKMGFSRELKWLTLVLSRHLT